MPILEQCGSISKKARIKNDRKKCFMSNSTAVFVMKTSSVKIKTTLSHYIHSRNTIVCD